MLRFALLYPTPDAAEDDFIEFTARCTPDAQAVPVYFPWPEGAGDLYDAVRELGSEAHLSRVIPPLPDFDVAVFAVTSASFLHGADGVARQLDTLHRLTGLPAVSTTSAFQHAVRHLGLSRVALASVYRPSASDHFLDRVAEAGATTVSRVDADASSDRELAMWTTDQIVSLVKASVSDGAQAVLLPETALHTADIGDLLDEAAGRPVLTATQVSVWAAYRALGEQPYADNAGALFSEEPGSVPPVGFEPALDLHEQ